MNNNDPATAPSKSTSPPPPTTNLCPLSESSPALTPTCTATASTAPTASNSVSNITSPSYKSSVASDPEFLKLFGEQLEMASQELEKLWNETNSICITRNRCILQLRLIYLLSID